MCLLRVWLVVQPHYMSLALTALVSSDHSGHKVEKEAKARPEVGGAVPMA